jgi:hypothetical protein
MPSLALGGLIGDVALYRDKAIDAAVAMAGKATPGDNRFQRDMANFIWPVYDWLFSYLTSTEKTKLRSKLSTLAKALHGRVDETEFASGHANGDQNAAFLAALAIHGEDSAAAPIVSRAIERYATGFWPFWREYGSENGGSFKGAWYTTVANTFNYEVMAAWKSATGVNLYQQEKLWVNGLADWYVHSLRGDSSWIRHGDVVEQQGLDELEKYLLVQIAKEFKNQEAQWLANKIRNYMGIWGPHTVRDILWYDLDLPAQSPTQSLSRHFRGSGMVCMRDSWGDNAVVANFRTRPYYTAGHDHLDHCSFSIFYKESLALDSGLYDAFGSRHHRNYYVRTIAHNAILVDDPGERFELHGDTYSADAGQYWVRGSGPENIGALTGSTTFDLGRIAGYENTSLYTYSVANGAPSYLATKMAKYFRHFLWVKNLSGWSHPVVIVFDQVESTNSSFKKTYLLHTKNQPSVSGSLVTATAGAGRLYQRTVFPQSTTITRVGGGGREFRVDGTNYPPNRSAKPGEDFGAWRVEVSPSTSRTRDEFLHVLYPTDSSRGSPPSVRAIDAVAMKGLETQSVVYLFAVQLNNVTSASYSVSGARRSFLFGLTPSRSYDIFLDGTRIATRAASVSGTLNFSTVAGGRIEVVRL